MTMGLYHVGAMLNPYLLNDLNIHEDATNKTRFLNVMTRLVTCIDGQYGRVVAKFKAFKKHKDAFANTPLAMEANIPPQEWWDLVGIGSTYSTPLAKHLGTQISSSSSCERNGNNYSFVHSKTESWLTLAKTKNLVHIYINARLVQERMDQELTA
jgi:hypothetical protein